MREAQVFCSVCSREAGDQVFGSAPRGEVWLLLEYRGIWGNKALKESSLSDAQKDQLGAWQKAIPHSKFMFIKRRRKFDTGVMRLYVAVTQADENALYRFDLQTYDDLLQLDIPALVRGEIDGVPYRVDEPLYTVCTNGRRDAACAKFGTPIYNALSQVVPESAWECTHFGGHRFAATMVYLPAGVAYGHLDVADVAPLLACHERGELLVDKMRGRTYYPSAAQAAEHYLREICGVNALDAVRLVGVDELDETRFAVRLACGGNVHLVTVRREMSAWQIYTSSADAEPSSVAQFHLDEHRVLAQE